MSHASTAEDFFILIGRCGVMAMASNKPRARVRTLPRGVNVLFDSQHLNFVQNSFISRLRQHNAAAENRMATTGLIFEYVQKYFEVISNFIIFMK